MRGYTSNSERSASVCEMRHFLAYGLGLEVPGTTQALSVGKAWHTLQEVYWTQGIEAAQAEAVRLCSADSLVPIESKDEGLGALLSMLEVYHVAHQRYPSLEVIAQEMSIETWTQAKVRRSTASRWLGIVDKVVRDHRGDLWVLEHKSTALSPSDWLDQHRDDYQPRIYAWLLSQQGIKTVGVIYDVVRRYRHPILKRKKDGALVKPRAGTLPRMSASQLRDQLLPQDRDLPWVDDIIQKLEARDLTDHWLKREQIRWKPDEIDRAAAEAHTVATRLRRKRDAVSDLRAQLHDKPQGCPRAQGRLIARIIRDNWGKHPRNTGECKKWGRLCDFAQACSNPTEITCSELRLRRERGNATQQMPNNKRPGEGSQENRSGSPGRGQRSSALPIRHSGRDHQLSQGGPPV